nr:DNA cytosine methyltransferase [Serratia proteamaculans]
MKSRAYYNEIDPYAAQWLRNLIAAGYIAPGDVDERSIEDVKPDDLRNYTQCHFFAGIGVWSYALRNAGWPDDKPVWTGSCPCQPFSAAGKGSGFDDERHLWPHFHWLISECRPEHVVGEQVASGNANAWFDLVQADLEAMDYAFGIVPFPSAGVGAPHIRDRAYWVANNQPSGLGTQSAECNVKIQRIGEEADYASACCGSNGLADANCKCRNGSGNRGAAGGNEYSNCCGLNRMANADNYRQQPSARGGCSCESCTKRHNHRGCGTAYRLADAEGTGRKERCEDAIRSDERGNQKGMEQRDGYDSIFGCEFPCATNGFWRDADWLFCRDEKWRPVRPGSFPLVDGAAARVGRLRAYGNAINAEAAKAFITAYMNTVRK